MKIILPIKQVPETGNVRMDEQTGTMVRDGVESIVNPLDLYAIELALRLREQNGGEIIAITMGPPSAEKALREAVAMGCDSAILLSDKSFAGADTWATGYVLSQAIRNIGGYDMIICGERATDGDTGQVGPGIASFLDLPVMTYVCAVDEISDKSCRVKRLIEDGNEKWEVNLPTVLTVVKEIAVPRLPTLRSKQKSRALKIPAWGAADVNADVNLTGLAGSPTRVVKIFRPQVSRKCEKISATDETTINAAADLFVEFLAKRELV
ncbi:MAG TPA: electron transfer flavoprotein subunit beta/FixA family protein [Phycisphaerae bacterium]|nr:electron transfer flavoprotein subunit beta/FixA family protein [Phycisphaerae bacterium]HPS53093.1 electron transfer flavoprotein subunit beta/FixA family protein [Phycisphaerae bacterium]